MSIYNEKKEISEAVNAGNEALFHLSKADELLSHAQNWGLADLFGGGMFITMMKRGKMADASREIEQSKRAMRELERQLSDIRSLPEINLEMNDFLGMADYFFDGVIADWFTQSRINDARAQVKNAIDEVQGILDGLEEML